MTETPAILVADGNVMDIEMEKKMIIQNLDIRGSQRVMEINIDHGMIKSMNPKISTSRNLKDGLASLLFDQSKILEG